MRVSYVWVCLEWLTLPQVGWRHSRIAALTRQFVRINLQETSLQIEEELNDVFAAHIPEC